MKTVRQQRILELIQMHDIEKQEELVQMLCEDGFDVTQATVSRDISQLRLKTVSGMAMAAAAALDACHFSEIVGCIAGDDTIMCAVRTVPDTIHLMKKIESILND